MFRAGWLDDIGLPQYKDAFADGRIDGRMMHYLTVVSNGSLLHFSKHQAYQLLGTLIYVGKYLNV